MNGKLLFCHAPPGIADAEFNEPTHKNILLRMAGKKRAPVTRVGKDSDTFVYSNVLPPVADGSILPAQALGSKSRAIDKDFFENNTVLSSKAFIQESGKELSRMKLYPHQNTVANDGTPIQGKPSRLAMLLEGADTGKKHKKMKRVKQRSGRGYD